jgi:hypothetical protein
LTIGVAVGAIVGVDEGVDEAMTDDVGVGVPPDVGLGVVATPAQPTTTNAAMTLASPGAAK